MKQFLILLLTISATISNSQSLDDKLEKISKESPMPGFGVSIINEDEVLFQGGFGYANKEMNIPYSADHSQIIASVSKTMIGISLVKCVELGLINLDDGINLYLPFKVTNVHFPKEQITIRHLATHTSGIKDQIEDHFKIYFNNDPYASGVSFSKKEQKIIDQVLKNEMVPLSTILESIFSREEANYSDANFLKAKPGSTYQYSNTASSLAALIVENVSKKSYEDFVSEHILNPLSMSNSSFFPNELASEIQAVHYTGKNTNPVPSYTHRMRPIGGLSSSINDLSKYLMEMIKGYSGNGTILTPSSYHLLFEPQYKDLPEKHPSNESNQGIFWTYRGESIGHTGGGLGASTFLFFNPTTGIGKIFITNCELESSKEFVTGFQQAWAAMTEFEKRLE